MTRKNHIRSWKRWRDYVLEPEKDKASQWIVSTEEEKKMGNSSQEKALSKTKNIPATEIEKIKRKLEDWLTAAKTPRVPQSHQNPPSPPAEEADRATDEYERTFDLHLKERAQVSANEIEEALGRLDEGTYGICESCDQAIGVPRLLAQPATRLCIECQYEVEVALERRGSQKGEVKRLLTTSAPYVPTAVPRGGASLAGGGVRDSERTSSLARIAER